MAGIKYTLQAELFEGDYGQILSLCRVKKSSYLVLVQTPIAVQVVQVKQLDRSVFKRKRTWSIEDIKVIDGKDVTNSTDFDLHIDKPYRWTAINPHERQNFIVMLWKHLKKIGAVGHDTFQNIPPAWLTDAAVRLSRDEQNADTETETGITREGEDGFEDFQALTDREELQLNKLMSECNFVLWCV